MLLSLTMTGEGGSLGFVFTPVCGSSVGWVWFMLQGCSVGEGLVIGRLRIIHLQWYYFDSFVQFIYLFDTYD